MLKIKGETRTDYFHVECVDCGKAVTLHDLRWVGGVPQVRAVCESCGTNTDLKLHVPTWIKAVPTT